MNSEFLVIDLASQSPKVASLGDYLFARQGDNRRPLKLWFQQNGIPFSLTDYTVGWEQTNAQKTPLSIEGTTVNGSVNGQVIFYFPSQAFSVVGTVTGHFVLKKDSTVISTIDMTFDVAADNVLMGIDTAPFMTDWENFKSSIANDVGTLTANVATAENSVANLQSSVTDMTSKIASNSVATKTDLGNFIGKQGDQDLSGNLSVSGNLSADALKLATGEDVGFWSRLKKTRYIFDEGQSGIYSYDSTDGSYSLAGLPPYLPDFAKKGHILLVVDGNTKTVHWLEAGITQRWINGSYTGWVYDHPVYLGGDTLKQGQTLTLAADSKYFQYLRVVLKMPDVKTTHIALIDRSNPKMYFVERSSDGNDRSGSMTYVASFGISGTSFELNSIIGNSNTSNSVTPVTSVYRIEVFGISYVS
ncbi:BppU family phage baseplate upper protein [Lactiplantibacillus plantarum]|uniref:BppU family phage baseplate upper protein n=1 Tax=Lactiplantibacillus plantarum TaxID=1590 RepID=UPI000D20DCFF|nr:BppU family phage baseplate upper protein [Lactiplantibacillus plantarum]AVV99544.1 hypothetical protein DA080_10325 [Lactiplantibacillus plantarum]MCC9313472.1 BppU family phage baseplate upper protein [Lactiplantibacillus plantarum]MDF3264318.1 BppU family phage baseplate upper protein [Lactiplantibacillus plantarum]MDO1602397.1 BppU family phage baseplate upper protein [Lactiplantibacillus plantarum]MEE4614863.1 BppU family phage baseplate upper protein [Lactiplantibacillus plantarum]